MPYFNSSLAYFPAPWIIAATRLASGFPRPFSNMAMLAFVTRTFFAMTAWLNPCCVRGNEEQVHSTFQLVAMRIWRQATTRFGWVSTQEMARYNHLRGSATTLSRQQGPQDSCSRGPSFNGPSELAGFSLVGSSPTAVHCARRGSTFRSCALREQEERRAIPCLFLPSLLVLPSISCRLFRKAVQQGRSE